MNRIDRLTAMILMLQSHRVLTAERIAEHFEISVRTVYRDISALGEAGVPIVAEAGVGYRLMRGYHMPPIMFTEEEAAALFMSGKLTEQFGDESLKQSLRGALLKVRAALSDERKDYLRRLSDAVSVWSRPTGLQEERSLMQVQKAVVRRRCIALNYDTGGRGEMTERVVEALGVMFYARRWHLIAWCRLRKDFRDFRLDRMRQWKVLEEGFEGHQEFSVMEYLKGQEGECELTSVTIECDRWVLERVLAEMPAQVVERRDVSDNRIRIDAQAYSLDWLAGWILGLGTAVEACAPDQLREKVREGACAIFEQYPKK